MIFLCASINRKTPVIKPRFPRENITTYKKQKIWMKEMKRMKTTLQIKLRLYKHVTETKSLYMT